MVKKIRRILSQGGRWPLNATRMAARATKVPPRQ